MKAQLPVLPYLDHKNATPLFPDDTTLDSIRILEGNTYNVLDNSSTGSSMTKYQKLNKYQNEFW